MYLQKTDSEGKIEHYELPAIDFSWLIGRSDACEIILQDKNERISRKHASLSGKDGCIYLRDLDSVLGTFLDGSRLTEEKRLEPGMQISIGGYALAIADCRQDYSQGNIMVEQENVNVLYTPELMELKKRIHNYALRKLDLPSQVAKGVKEKNIQERLVKCLDESLKELRHELPTMVPESDLRQALMDEIIGYGPISPLLRIDSITEIMVNGPYAIFIEERGRLKRTPARFYDDEHLQRVIQKIVEPLGRRVDQSSPMVDARLPDGSRVNAIIPPLALHGASVTIRKFAKRKLTADDLIGFGTMTHEMDLFLREAVRVAQNILVSGGTGSGKTTLLNVLSQYIPLEERIVTIEDSAELKLSHDNIVSLEARPPNLEGKGEISIKRLVINALRMRPDRIIVGECRGAEAWDMLQAMNTGHDGSLTTCHANSARDALMRVENMVLMANMDMPSTAIREQIVSALDLIIQEARLPDGSRKIIQISEVAGREGDVILLSDIFKWESHGYDENGKALGKFVATGNIPRFVEILRQQGNLHLDMSVFVPKV